MKEMNEMLSTQWKLVSDVQKEQLKLQMQQMPLEQAFGV
jgi:hypothetical protein